MPKDMSETELTTHLAAASQIDTCEFRDDENGDNYVIAALFKLDDGRAFRVIEASGMDSQFAGAGNFGEWLSGAEVENWKTF